MIGKLLDRKYRIVRELGRGGMGAVFEAKHVSTGRRVAVKLINSEHITRDTRAVARFQREARASGAADNRHIVQVLDAGTEETSGAPYLVLEYLVGEDLHSVLKASGALPPDVALRIVGQACLGLQKSHEVGVVHRDIKPANIFLTRGDDGEITVKLLDFGIAKIKPEGEATDDTTGLTRTGSLIGSPQYMSPEQARGVKDIDHRTDLWSLGVVLFRALAGRTPNDGIDAIGELILALCARPPVPVQDAAPWVRSEIAAIVHDALQISRAARVQSAAAMLAAIRAVLPDGLTLQQNEIVPVTEATRAMVAPRSEPSVTVMSGEVTAEVFEHEGATFRESISGMDTTELAHIGPPACAEERRPADARPWRSRAPAILGSALLVGAAALGVYRLTSFEARPPADSTAMQPAMQPETAPSPSPSPSPTTPTTVASSALRRVSVVIVPADAAVEVGGERMAAQDGIVAIQGALGSTHRVRLWKGKNEILDDVAITETGALPAKLELVEAPTPAKTKGNTSPAAGSAAASRPASGPRAGNPAATGAGKPAATPPHGAPPTIPSPPADPLIPRSFE